MCASLHDVAIIIDIYLCHDPVVCEGVNSANAECPIYAVRAREQFPILFRVLYLWFKPPDKTPRTYDKQVIKLNGRIALDITFGDKTMKTKTYVKNRNCYLSW